MPTLTRSTFRPCGSLTACSSTATSRLREIDYQHLRLVKSPSRPRDGFFLRAGGPPIIGAYVARSLHEQSHGKSFLALMLHRLRGRGLYILDEPEAALSPTRQLAVLRRLHQLVQA